MGNLRNKKGKFTSRKQPAKGESISYSCFFYIMIDIRVNSDLAKTKIVTFALKIIKTTVTREEFILVNVETDKNLSSFDCCV